MMDDKLTITKKDKIKGEDGYKVFSVRLKEEIVNNLDIISTKTNRSRNELINTLLEYAIANCQIADE